MNTKDIREKWKIAYSKMTDRYIGDKIADWWLAELSTALDKQRKEIALQLQMIRTDPDNYLRGGIIDLLSKLEKKQ